jgi:heme A synthase
MRTRHRRAARRIALKYGLACGLPIGTLGAGNAVLQAYRHAGGPERRPLVAGTYGLLVLAIGLANLAASRSTHSTGHLRTGMLSGSLTAIPLTLVLIGETTIQMAGKGQLETGAQITGLILAAAVLVALGMLLGALVSLPGALVGRVGYRFDAAVPPHDGLPRAVDAPIGGAAEHATAAWYDASGIGALSPARHPGAPREAES